MLFFPRCDIIIEGDGTHNKKQRKLTEGMTPMTKNITVVDENDNILESTYPKRAKGLIKKGRAQWVSDSVIRLCAQSKKEENEMADNIYEILDNQLSKMQEQLRDAEDSEATSVRIQILKTLEVFRAQEQGAKLIDIVKEQLDAMQKSLDKEDAFTPENILARETTRQKMLDIIGSLINLDSKQQEIPVKAEEKSSLELL